MRRDRLPGRRRAGAALAAAAVWLGFTLVLLLPAPARAHPLGNVSVNHHASLRVLPDRVHLDLVVDLAELPSAPELRAADRDGDRQVDEAERQRHAAGRCATYARGVSLRLDGAPLRPAVRGTSLFLLPGEAGLTTVRLECRLNAEAVATAGRRLDFRDGTDPDRPGWREVVADAGGGVRLAASDVPRLSRSAALTRYAPELAGSPPRQVTASLRVAAGTTAAAAPEGSDPHPPILRGFGGPADALARVAAIEQARGGWAALVAVAAATMLGAGHALAPGHGKTAMAAYLIVRRGAFRDAAVVGLSVTATHTAGVLALAALISLSAVTAPERVYPWLQLANGFLLAALGGILLGKAGSVTAHPPAHGHPHPHDDHQSHGRHHHDHPHPEDHPRSRDLSQPDQPAPGGDGGGQAVASTRAGRLGGLLAMGFAGGLVPSPSALLVLVGAMAAGRPAYGVGLVLAYGVGMAAALTAIGLLLKLARDRVEAWPGVRRPWLGGWSLRAFGLARRLLPAATATAVLVAGCVIAARALAALP